MLPDRTTVFANQLLILYLQAHVAEGRIQVEHVQVRYQTGPTTVHHIRFDDNGTMLTYPAELQIIERLMARILDARLNNQPSC
jgi:hypothetical protein